MLQEKYHDDDCTCKKIRAPLMLIENAEDQELDGEAYLKEMLANIISDNVELTSLQLVIKKGRMKIAEQRRLKKQLKKKNEDTHQV